MPQRSDTIVWTEDYPIFVASLGLLRTVRLKAVIQFSVAPVNRRPRNAIGLTERPTDKSPYGYNRWYRVALASSVGFTVSGGPTLRECPSLSWRGREHHCVKELMIGENGGLPGTSTA
ncbi:hypothetical protein BDM02DRAFT_3132717 [Thelephora ganbajun]|uniref:Uncharacterized protein n=1 Tax=Thelephora ganbajun TaxID=370292 RepID=A0ACB6Z0T4_THEGA|nr:hypothetical protein BDM02DRAFT_3132717 [Thelephora ganbajun]